MESLDTTSNFIENMLNGFLSDMEEPREAITSSTFPNGVLSPDNHTHEFAEEELEWISNKDAFPALETFVDIPSQHPSSLPKQQSPVSVLENHTTSSYNNNNGNGMLMSCCGNLKAPRRARSKRRLRHRQGDFNQLSCISQANNKNDNFNEKVKVGIRSASIGRKCQHCGIEKTPQWREGPVGPKTLCNACGVRYKSGRLVPEYRPANSPTFLSKLHSNSHRKVMEMRRLKQMMGMMAKHVETV